MKLVLKRFYQAVELDSPDVESYFLVFSREDGSDVHLPVSKSTTEALVKVLYTSPVSNQTVPKNHKEDVEEEESEEMQDEYDSDVGGSIFSASDALPPPSEDDDPDDLDYVSDDRMTPSPIPRLSDRIPSL